MNDILKGFALIFGGKLMQGEKKDTSLLYDEYNYHQPFSLPKLYNSMFGNTFVYHKGNFKRNDAEIFADNIIEMMETEFGITFVLAEATTGSTISRIKLMPVNNIRKAFNKAREIKYILNREDIRVYAEGSYVVVEVPNVVEEVRFGDFMHDKEFINNKCKTVVPIGQDSSGHIEYADIAKMPHMLVAGTTGSGKSVFLNTIITSLLMKNTPDDMQMFIIDPKMVDFKPNYQSLRYVHCIDEPREAVVILQKLVDEMDHRYAVLSTRGCNNIEAFNAKYPNNKMPRLILIVDEMADLLDAGDKKAIESKIVRIAQKARAAGIHMILSTQRPTKDVVTGRIKANIACRVALSVTSKVDSLIILDRIGAENLLGKGDMLFLDGKNNKEAKRLQGGYIEPAEIHNVVIPLVKENQPFDYARINWNEVDLPESEIMRLMM